MSTPDVSPAPVHRLVGRIPSKYVGVVTNQQSKDYISVAHMIQAIATVCCASDEIIIDRLIGYLWDPDEAELLKSLFYPPNSPDIQPAVIGREMPPAAYCGPDHSAE
jgi:hypothetical protein